jgi:hypothetical protein
MGTREEMRGGVSSAEEEAGESRLQARKSPTPVRAGGLEESESACEQAAYVGFAV